jgi:serine phosphatase RsbU (regulator of sigma subunit)
MSINPPKDMAYIKNWPRKKIIQNLLLVQETAALALSRGTFPQLPNIDYFASTEPYESCVGGDYWSVVNFHDYNLDEKIKNAESIARETGDYTFADRLKKNCDSIGIIIGDVLGHGIPSSIIAGNLYIALKIGINYELKINGEITPELFELLNTLFYNYTSTEFLHNRPYTTMLYGEIHNDGRFRFLSAGHPAPSVFSNEYDKMVNLEDHHRRASTPLGVLPSKYHVDIERFELTGQAKEIYSVNEINLLGRGDILLLYTDGLTEQDDGRLNFYDQKLESVLREAKAESAKNIYDAIKRELFNFYPPDDDVTMVVIKKK